MKFFMILLSALSVFVLSSCAPRVGGDHYSIHGVGELSNSEKGTIVAARVITISAKSTQQDNQLGAGAAVGGVGGAVLGSQLGGGRGRYVTGTLGALAGGVAGHLLEQKLTDQEGMEYHVKLDSGRTVVVSQGMDPRMAVGQRVTVIESMKDRSRVVPAA